MSNFKFFSLRVGNLKLDNLSGLCTETIDIATPIVPGLGFPLLDAKLNALTTDTATLRSLMNRW
ncbi:MAG: hypothetical protein LBF19_05555, partial [Prevotellaceae bacterium]|nr:hypothetical protein [Prevotellaceae bacterium]